jgi:hypothetical protein
VLLIFLLAYPDLSKPIVVWVSLSSGSVELAALSVDFVSVELSAARFRARFLPASVLFPVRFRFTAAEGFRFFALGFFCSGRLIQFPCSSSLASSVVFRSSSLGAGVPSRSGRSASTACCCACRDFICHRISASSLLSPRNQFHVLASIQLKRIAPVWFTHRRPTFQNSIVIKKSDPIDPVEFHKIQYNSAEF